MNWKAHHGPCMSNPFESADKQNASRPAPPSDSSQNTVDFLPFFLLMYLNSSCAGR